jgi:hypothetical protein
VALAAACALTLPAAAADGGNPVANPGAEDGAEPGEPPAPPRSWTANGGFTVLDYGAPDAPDLAAGSAISGGAKLFAGGPGNDEGLPAESSAAQFLDVSANAAGIDAGSVRAELSAALGGAASEPDSGRVAVQFRSSDGVPIGTQLVVGPVTAEDRGGQTKLLSRSASASVPAGTRQVRVVLLASGTGPSNDAYFDNVALAFPGAAQPVVPVGGGGTGGGPGSGPGGGSAAPAPLTLSTRPVRMTRSGVVALRVACGAEGPCRGRLDARSETRRSKRCGSVRASIPARRRKVLKLRLSRACRRLVSSRRRGARITFAFRLADGRIVEASVPVRRPF